jgi:hypothetical protein
MKSIFNTNRQVTSRAQVASSEYAIVQLGGRSELAQQVTGNYGREIRQIYEIGSPNIMWVGGHESGALNFSRIVGTGGFFDGLDNGECGVIRPVSINLGGGPCVAVASGGLHFGEAMLERVDFSLSVASVEITEGISLRVATMSRV